MVEGETSRIWERSTETISGDTSSGRRDLSNRYSVPVIGGQKIDIEKFDGKINFGMWRREVMDALIQIDLDVVLKNKRHLYDEEIWDRMNEKVCAYVANSSEWILDTGATYYLCPIKEWFTDFRNLESGVVVMGNDQPCRTMGIGIIRLKMFDGMVRELKDVRFVPALKKNLISVDALEDKGYKVTIEDGIMKFTHRAMVILQGVRRHNLYYLKGGTTDEANVVETHSDTTELWHVRLRHAREKSLQTLMRHGLLKSTKTCKLNLCEYCIVGKKTRVRFGTTNHDTREILEYVHSDVWGPTKTASIGGSHYFVTFVDDFSRRVWVYTMRAKDEVLEIFVKWMKLVETQTGRTIKVLRSDNGNEYTSDLFLQNGVAERMNHTLLEKVRCILSNAGLDKKFWAEAMSYASHLVNWLLSAAVGGKTPMKMWSGKHAQDYDSLRIFGCPAYYHVKDGKLDHRARKAIFVGFKGGVKGFKLWDLEDKKFMCSRDVTFDEASMMKTSSSQQVENKTKEVLQRVEFDATPYVPVSSTSKKGSTMEVTPGVKKEVVSYDVPQNKETIDDVDNDDFIAIRRPIREIKKPGWLTKDMAIAYALLVIDDDIPNTFSKALRSSESDQWKSQEERDYMARVPYASAVGSLMYVMVCTRPDISQAVNMVSRYMHNLEYMAATEAVTEAIWLKGLLGDLGVIQENIVVFCDNQSAIFLVKNQTYHARTKYIDVKYHYVREIIESDVVLLRKIDTKDNPSDMLTKLCPSGILNYGWLDPKFWVRRQSQRCSHFGDDNPLDYWVTRDKPLLFYPTSDLRANILYNVVIDFVDESDSKK
ncbi:Integrase catalytic domain-containing protein [Citrus sinensis]|uniref:Integrase catalytic domain-containing protein n=1 Tax=Citrus sinensis TaxID=2711 RepID=A0ACB8M3D7_CITSI|nr:Integrase catalytic domain-containing protein [Citrus sinensis]